MANEFTQQHVAAQFNRLTGKPSAPMKAARISEYESWPGARGAGRVHPRPTLDVLKNLAVIYRTSWDQLVDTADLAQMPSAEVAAYRAVVARRTTALPAAADSGFPSGLVPFVGRTEPQRLLRERIEAHLYSGGPGVHVVNGLAGVGKTALARWVVETFGDRYPDGIIWENLHGHTDGRPPRTPAGVLEQMLLKLGVPPETIKTDTGHRSARWRHEMRDRRSLIVFDNVLDSKQVRALLPEARDSFVLITSRHKLTGLTGAVPLQLDAMEPSEAEELLVEFAHLPPDYDVEAARLVLRAAGGLPLAIRLIAGQIAYQGPDLLGAAAAEFTPLADRMRQGPDDGTEDSLVERALDLFSAEGETLRAAFELSYQRLPDLELQRCVRLLGWFPGTEITAETLAPMVGVPQAQAYGLIRQIFEVGLLDPAEAGPNGQRYRIHDVTKLFARVKADAADLPSEHAAAVGRLVRHCLSVARQAGVQQPYESAGSFPAPLAPDPTGTTQRARAWLARERELLLGCVRVTGSERGTGELARLLGAYLSELGHLSDARGLLFRALAIARDADDRTTACDILFELGTLHRRACAYETAAACFQEAHDIATALDDTQRIAATLWGLADITRHRGDYDRARIAYSDVLGMARQLENPKFEGDALRGLGHMERMGGDRAIAHRYYLDALRIAGEIGDTYSLGWSLWGLGSVSRESGEFDTARTQLTKALTIGGEIGDHLLRADALRGLGHLERDVGDLDAAQEFYAESLDITRRTRDPHGEADVLRALAYIALRSGGAHWRPCDLLLKSLLLYESMGIKLAEQVRSELVDALSRCRRESVLLPDRIQEDLRRLGFDC
ncbi:tetratricopeptide repeat protein [Nocardia sp. CDC160]|uniref:tetratricopeptide repeat protein n=1 Tax=Nocardia sp. CDC160 TaxID=3112166 RepID=UPI002DBC3E4E|nr:tetratricopeptide repeat protein [Nocardia sp. CDC160]MEC3919667.1 tetratricopeptide repeat protein [Nocardia sp. CDC160]